MKCPFCGAELKRCSLLSSGLKNPVFMCENKQCEYDHIVISSQIWQALIDGKKAQDALKVAIKGIKEIEYDNERGLGEGGGLYSDDTPFEELLKEITSITTQELDK